MKWLRVAFNITYDDISYVGKAEKILVPVASLHLHVSSAGVIDGVMMLERWQRAANVVVSHFAVDESGRGFEIEDWRARTPEELLIQAELHGCIAGGGREC